jgi:GNAT superfamily N-acetyltransferase
MSTKEFGYMKNPSDEIEIRDYVGEDEGPVLDLIQHGMGGGPTGTRDRGFWQWKHFHNPFGPSIALVAVYKDGQIIGLRTFMRWRFQTGDRPVSAVRAVDTVTHPDYRRYGVFSRLTREAVAKVKNNGVDFIFNTPNATVLPGYLKLGWSLVSRIRPQIKILNYPRFIMGIARSKGKRQPAVLDTGATFFRQELLSINEFLGRGDAVEQLLQSREQKRDNRLHTRPTLDYLRWRYVQYPFVKYRVISWHDRGALSGCIIFRPSGRLGMKEIVLSELIVPGYDRTIASGLIKEMVKHLNADYIVAYFPEHSFERETLRKNGFHDLPFQGINFAVNSLKEIPGLNPLQFNNWELGLGDLEIF